MMEQAAERLRGILQRMGIEGSVSAREDEEHITLEIAGTDAGLVIGRQGTTLDALQYLVNKMMGREPGERKPIVVDAEGYRGRREETLLDMANRLAEKAMRTGQPVTAQAMSAADRRIIHLALAEIPGVTTRSEGEGLDRRLIVEPAAIVDPEGQADLPEEK